MNTNSWNLIKLPSIRKSLWYKEINKYFFINNQQGDKNNE